MEHYGSGKSIPRCWKGKVKGDGWETEHRTKGKKGELKEDSEALDVADKERRNGEITKKRK